MRVAEKTASHGSAATTSNAAPPCVEVGQRAENRKLKVEETKDCDSRPGSSHTTPSKKFLKSKSRIFNFFR